MKGHTRFRNGAWRLQVYAGIDPDTGRKRWVQRTVKAPNNRAGAKLADQALARLILEVEARGTAVRDDVTVAQLLERWFAAHELGWSPGTVKEHRLIIDGRIVPRLGGRKVASLRRHHLNAFYADLRRAGGRNGQPLAATTVKRTHVVLHAALREAQMSDLIASNPAEGAVLPSAPPRTPTAPTPDELNRALREVDSDPELALFLRLAAGTGARRGQLCALRWTDVDLDGGAVTFARAIAIGRGGMVEKGTKTGRVHTVSLDPQIVERLQAHRREYLTRALASGAPRDGFVFLTKKLEPWYPSTVTRRWRKAANAVGLEHIQLRQLRHFMVTQMLAAGYDVRAVANRAGHSQPSVTLNSYAAYLPQRDQDAANFLGGLLDDGERKAE